MKEKAQALMHKLGERVLETQNNSISLGLHLGSVLKGQDATELGSILYSKKVMGHRIIAAKSESTKVCGITFGNYGSHHESYPFLPYMTIACAIGTERQEIDEFFIRLESALREHAKKDEKLKRLQKDKTELPNTSVEEKKEVDVAI